MIAASIDLGTNTFNLLIAETSEGHFKPLHVDRIPVKLGKGGINNGMIADDSFQRGIDAMRQYNAIIKKFKCSRVIAAGTSMLRDARNGSQFLERVLKETGIQIQIISGDEEAILIWKGVRQCIHFNQPKLIMDIGGGSTEFIIADTEKIIWKKSYPLGITRLYEKFSHSDPISDSDQEVIISHLDQLLNDLYEMGKIHQIKNLIGSAGSFETYANMIRLKEGKDEIHYEMPAYYIDLSSYWNLSDTILKSKHNDRCKMTGLPEFRRDLIVIATLFVSHIITRMDIQSLELSMYALKEGAISEL